MGRFAAISGKRGLTRLASDLWDVARSKLDLDKIRCVSCLRLFVPSTGTFSLFLCPECQGELSPFAGLRCRSCSAPLPGLPPGSDRGSGALQTLCADCLKTPRPWVACSCYGLYEKRLREIIIGFKFGVHLAYEPLLVDFLLHASCGLARPDMVVPIPQHVSQLRKRGFNQAHELGRQFCRVSALEFSPHALTRARKSQRQEELGARERRRNMQGAFVAPIELAGKRVWLLDDVMTTGSTCESAAKALLAAGAESVSVLCVARTPQRA